MNASSARTADPARCPWRLSMARPSTLSVRVSSWNRRDAGVCSCSWARTQTRAHRRRARTSPRARPRRPSRRALRAIVVPEERALLPTDLAEVGHPPRAASSRPSSFSPRRRRAADIADAGRGPSHHGEHGSSLTRARRGPDAHFPSPSSCGGSLASRATSSARETSTRPCVAAWRVCSDACVLGLAGPLRVWCVPRRLDREEDRGFGCSTKEIDPRLRWAVIGQLFSRVNDQSTSALTERCSRCPALFSPPCRRLARDADGAASSRA